MTAGAARCGYGGFGEGITGSGLQEGRSPLRGYGRPELTAEVVNNKVAE